MNNKMKMIQTMIDLQKSIQLFESNEDVYSKDYVQYLRDEYNRLFVKVYGV